MLTGIVMLQLRHHFSWNWSGMQMRSWDSFCQVLSVLLDFAGRQRYHWADVAVALWMLDRVTLPDFQHDLGKAHSMNRIVAVPILVLMMSTMTLLGAEPNGKLKVFILAGQSNMQGHAKVTTFGYIGQDPATAPMLKEMQDENGRPRICDNVWISYLTGGRNGNGEGFGRLTAGYGARPNPAEDGGKIGPEFTFGITMDSAMADPILLIKTAWGGKSLHTDFRPPSAGPYEPTPKDIEKKRYETAEQQQALKEKTGRYYRDMIEYVHRVLEDIPRVYPEYDADKGYEIAGFVWFQGWNDRVNRDVYPVLPKDSPGNRYAKYSLWMADFIRDVRKDLNVPTLPFVIGVMGVGGIKEDAFREAMAAPASQPEFRGNVTAVQTAPFWDVPLSKIDAKRGEVRQMGYYLRKKHKNYANKDGHMTPEDMKAYQKKFEAELISPAEKAQWESGASNAGYHYLGCGKTMALIGKGFAEAMIKMIDSQAGSGRRSRRMRGSRRGPAQAAAADATVPVRFDPVRKNIEGWTVHVDPQLLTGEHSDTGAEALKMLANHLQRVAILIPEPQLGKMKKLEIWIEYRHPRLGAMQYHPSAGWLKSNGHDLRLAKKVHITRAENLLSREQMLKHPAVILHELAHAFHDQYLTFEESRIIEAFKKAQEAGIYEDSLLYTGATVRHYGLSNHKEYFAEGTEAFFYRNDFYPFVRAELKEHDPTLHSLLSDIWGGEG